MPGIFKKIKIFVFISLVFLSTCLMLRITVPYFSFRYDIDFLLTKQSVLHITAWRWAFYTHITCSIFVLILGGLQFVPAIVKKYTRVHRRMGKAYIILVLGLSAPSGLIMGFYANGGVVSKISFVLLSLLWWLFTFLAYRQIKKKNIESHINFMYRSYALTLSAITFRIYVMLVPHFIHLPAKEMYSLIAWLSWAPNLLVTEILIKNRTKWDQQPVH